MKVQHLSIACLALFGSCADAQTMAYTDLMEIGRQIISSGCHGTSETTEEKVANRYNAKVADTIKTVSCSGIQMQIYMSPTASDPNGLGMNLSVSALVAQIPEKINIGQSIEQLVSVLGSPATKTAESITYYPGETDDTVTFVLEQNHVKSIRWSWYLE